MHRPPWVISVVTIALVASTCSSAGATTQLQSTTAAQSTGPCAPLPNSTGGLLITPTCDDPALAGPYTDVDEQRSTTDPATDTTVSYRYIHGGFAGSNTKFSFYFPAKSQYLGRFFQPTYPTNSVEDASRDSIVFGISNGAYVVSTNNNGGLPGGLPLSGYRANAAAAKYSRVVAAQVYETTARPRGYIYGASGGAYQTLGAAENTDGVWDGAVPMVPGTPNSIPSNQAIELLGLRVLHDKLPAIADALEPGGSGDPYAGLNAEERKVLEETQRMGFPVRGWWDYATLTGGSFSAVEGGVRALDSTYADDFWTKPGYEGGDPSVSAARVQQDATVVRVVPAPTCSTGQVIGTICPAAGIVVTDTPAAELLTAADLTVTSGVAAGQTLTIDSVTDQTVHFAGGSGTSVINAIQPGDTVRMDNSWALALQYYPRHQVPSPDLDMYGWDQYRDAGGNPIYAQRAQLLGPIFAQATGGTAATGQFHGKMIMLGSILDTEAFAWSADWYRRRAQEAMGRQLDDNFRLWYMDNAGHTEPRTTYARTHIVDYAGELRQALLDLDAWVRKDTPPPASTTYTVDRNSEVQVPATAAARHGVQPVVTLEVGGETTVNVKVGDRVRFTAEAEVPKGGGAIVDADWDFEGTGAFPDHVQVRKPARSTTLTAAHTYDTAGTYLAVVVVTAQRDGNAKDPYRRIPNLARVRVVVR